MSAHAKLIFADTMRNELTFCGELSRLGIIKLYKRMCFNMVIKIEEVVEETVQGQTEKQKMFRSLENSNIDFATSV